MLHDMQEFTDAADWQKVHAVLGKLHLTIDQVPRRQRGELILEATRSVEKIQQAANYARNEVWEKLSSIRRGRMATETYRAASAQR
jgi:hypothetical protein